MGYLSTVAGTNGAVHYGILNGTLFETIRWNASNVVGEIGWIQWGEVTAICLPQNSAQGSWYIAIDANHTLEWIPDQSGYLTAGCGSDGDVHAAANDASWLEVRYDPADWNSIHDSADETLGTIPEPEPEPEPEPVPAVVPVSEPALTLEPLLTLGEQAAAPDAEPQSRAETPVREATPADTPAAKPAEPPPSAEREQARPEPPDIDLAIEQALSETARARPSDEFPPPNLTPEPVPQRLPPPPRRDAGADIDRALSDTLDQLARAPAPRTSPPVEYRLPTPEFRPDPADRAPRRQAPNRNAEISRALSGVESHFGQREGGAALPPPPPPVAQRPLEDVQARGRSPAPAEPVAQTPQQAPRTVGGRRADTRYDPNGRPGAYSVNANDFFSRIAEHIFESNDRFVGRLPEGARRLVLDVRFTIDRAGRVMRVDLVSSSGNAALDQAAKDVIWRASPMPQMAQDMISETLELTFPVIVAR